MKGQSILLVLALVSLCGWSATPVAAGQARAPDALVVLNCEELAEMREVVGRIEQAGGAVRHVFPPHALIASLPRGAEAALADDGRVDLVSYQAVDLWSVRAAYGRAAREAVAAWNRVFAAPQPMARPEAPPGAPLVGDALLPPAPPAGELQAAGEIPYGARWWQTSEFMMGSVVVSVVLPESNGAVDSSTEDWNAERESGVASEIVAGLDWWVAQYPYAVGRPSFTYTFNWAVPTGYEPIRHPRREDGLWIAEVMTALGHPADSSNYRSVVTEYDDELRQRFRADWAFTAFVVDSLNSVSGQFTDGHFAYAYLGGPYLLMTYDNDGWGSDRMDRVLAHEVGHIFRAGDEYCQSSSACCDPNEYDGYLKVRNSNCDTGVTCVMVNNASAVCSVTRDQVGWRDADGDGCPDILDVAPTASLNVYAPDPTTDGTPTYTGSAFVNCYPNQLYPGADVTVNRIAAVEYRVDGGVWQACVAEDGSFDAGQEGYAFTMAALPAGTCTVEVRALDSSGNVSDPPYAGDTLTVISPHVLLVSAAAELTPIYSQGVTPLTAVASDNKGHGISAWRWTDHGAGGAFSPGAEVQNPSYAAPAKIGEGDRQLTLSATATCDGSPSDTATGSVVITVHDFADVGHDHWAADEVYACYRAGIVSGYPDGSYQPGASVTRDQMAAYLARALAGGEAKVPTGPAESTFPDVPSEHWAHKYVEYAQGNGVVAGYPDGLYHPELVVDRGQMAVFIARAMAGGESAVPDPGCTAPVFPDVPCDFWARRYIQYIRSAGVTSGYPDGKYHPESVCTRDQMAVYVARGFALPR